MDLHIEGEDLTSHLKGCKESQTWGSYSHLSQYDLKNIFFPGLFFHLSAFKTLESSRVLNLPSANLLCCQGWSLGKATGPLSGDCVGLPTSPLAVLLLGHKQ